MKVIAGKHLGNTTLQIEDECDLSCFDDSANEKNFDEEVMSGKKEKLDEKNPRQKINFRFLNFSVISNTFETCRNLSTRKCFDL